MCPKMLRRYSFSPIQRRFDGKSAALENMSVDHGGFYIFVPEEFLDSANVVSVLQKVGGETVSVMESSP